MSMIRKGGTREAAPEGTHLARIVGVTNIGHQPAFNYGGGVAEDKWKIELCFELAEKMSDGRPFHVSKEYTNTDNEKGTLVSIAQAIGKSVYEIEDWVNTPCMVQYGPNKNGKLNVLSVAGVPGSIAGTVPPLENEAWVFDMNAPEADLEGWAKLHKWRREKIKKALNFQETDLYAKLLASGDLDDDDNEGGEEY